MNKHEVKDPKIHIYVYHYKRFGFHSPPFNSPLKYNK